MLTMQDRLRRLYTALTAINGLPAKKVYHDEAENRASLPYLVWREENEAGSLEADNHKQEQALAGYVEYYTLTEFDQIVDEIQNTLNAIDGLSWTFDSRIPFDPSFDDDNVISYSWSWRLR